jgi:pimeloyl-ACP methyl ester carboxylesterase
VRKRDHQRSELVKTALVLVPGLLCDRRLWQHQVENLGDLAEPVVADVTGSDTIDGLAHAVLRAAPDRFFLAGLSLGGYVSLGILRAAPERVMRLALLDTSARTDTPEQTVARLELMELAQGGRFEEVPQRLLPSFVHPRRLDDTALTSTVVGMAQAVGPEAFVRQERVIINRPDARQYLAAISCPTLVLCGREDALTPLYLSEELADGIPHARLRVIEGCGHLSTIERPEEATAALREWLKGT